MLIPLSIPVSYNINQMVLVWENFTVDESIYFPKFRIDEYSSMNACDKAHVRRSCIRAVLRLSRKVSFYVTRFYAPTLLITMATFISYWMPAGDIAPRVAIHMTPFLTLVTLHNALNNEIAVSYVVALHIWFFACTFYAGLGLVVLFFAMRFHAAERRRQAEEEKKRVMHENNHLLQKLSRCVSEARAIESKSLDKDIEVHDVRRRSSILGLQSPAWLSREPPHALTWLQKKGKKLLTRLFRQEDEYVNGADRVARVLAPTSFAAFAATYFIIFCNYSE